MNLQEQALIHSSVADQANNERLEFFGDAVLKLVISNYLFERYPDAKEGLLTKYRASLVSDDLLARIGHGLKIDEKIQVGPSLQAQTKLPKSIIGDAVEALIAAHYLESGYNAAEKFILENWAEYLEDALAAALTENYKSELQDYLQKKYGSGPKYKLIEDSGPDHDKKFLVGVYFEGELLGKGSGNSKKEASMKAAQAAVEAIKSEEQDYESD